MRRHIPFTGTPNFRDLGGYQSRNGKRVKWNCFYRSGELSGLSAEDLDRFASLGVRVVCDFRRAEEAARDPSILPDDAALELLQLSIDPGSAGVAFSAVDARNHIDMAQFMCAINRAFALEHHGPYSRMLEAISHLHDGAMLFHCAAGKDRTGFAAALILMMLDVPREEIMRDYMLTHDYFLPDRELQRLLQKYAGVSSSLAALDHASIRPILEVRPEYLQAAFDAIDANYATTEDYLEDVFTLTLAERRALQQRFLD